MVLKRKPSVVSHTPNLCSTLAQGRALFLKPVQQRLGHGDPRPLHPEGFGSQLQSASIMANSWLSRFWMSGPLGARQDFVCTRACSASFDL